MKKYAIVRVDNVCPLITEDNFYCFEDLQKDKCKKCKEIRGDTKEQLVRKLLQVMMRKYTISYLRTTGQDRINPKHFKSAIDYYLEIAKEIVDFLGVEE